MGFDEPCRPFFRRAKPTGKPSFTAFPGKCSEPAGSHTKVRKMNYSHSPFVPNVNGECSAQADNQLRMAAYEVLNAFVTNAAQASLPVVAKLSDYILERLEETIPMQQQIVSVEDRITLEEMQTSLTSVLLVSVLNCLKCEAFTDTNQAIIQRLEEEIRPQADRIMIVF